jgi:hypothetical protein
MNNSFVHKMAGSTKVPCEDGVIGDSVLVTGLRGVGNIVCKMFETVPLEEIYNENVSQHI